MEKPQLQRREKIAIALVAAAAGLVALQTKKEGKTGIARLYPGGHFFADIIKDAKDEASTRLAFLIKDPDRKVYDFGDAEHSDEDLDEVINTFGLEITEDNPLQSP